MQIVKCYAICYAFMMSIECEDQIDIYSYDLQELSLDYLKSLLNLVSSCSDCEGCGGQIKLLQRYIEEKEKKE